LQPFAVESRGFPQNAEKSLAPGNVKFVSVKYSLINSRNWVLVMSDVTLHVNTTPLTVEDQLPIKTEN